MRSLADAKESPDADETLDCVQEVCGVTRERAQELLDAAGSIERAVDVHFGAVGDRSGDHETEVAVKSTRERKHEGAQNQKAVGVPLQKRAKTTPVKQSTLRSFFQAGVSPLIAAAKPGPVTTGEACIEGIGRMVHNSVTRPPHSDTGTSIVGKMTLPLDNACAYNFDPRLQYRALALTFSKLAGTTKRLVKINSLKIVLKGVIEAVGGIYGSDDDRRQDGVVLQWALELILGTAGTSPLQVSGSAVSKAVLAVTGTSPGNLREVYRKTGDLGDASEHFVRNQTLLVQPKPLTISTVHERLRTIAAQEGKGSQNQRHSLMVKLLRSCKADELRFLVRTLLGNMRLGANIRTVLSALGHAVAEIEATKSNDSPESSAAAKAVQDTFDFCPRLDKLSLSLLCGGISYMEQTCALQVGTPLNPMLANAAHSLEEVEKLMNGDPQSTPLFAVAEWKYDGVRCQAHFDGHEVTLYSRHMLNNTNQFPDVVEALLAARRPKVTSFIIDAEIVAVELLSDDSVSGGHRLLPFQDLSTRRGSSEREDGSRPIPVCLFAFDLLYVNGFSLVKESLHVRQAALKKHFVETDMLKYAASIALQSFDERALGSFLEEAVAGGAEGLMVKLTGEERQATQSSSQKASPSCTYEAGARSHTWLKVKRDYVSGYADTIDVIPIGAWFGNGRKAQKGFLSPVLLAIYDEEEDIYRSISRCMSFTDAMYDAMRKFYFHGTPYPADVGIDERKTSTTASAGPSEIDVDDHSNDGESIDAAAHDDDGEEARQDRVNCYPHKPSSALVVTNENPPLWFKPSEVWEVSFADLSLSRQHTAAAGLVHESRGVALRFPRFKRRRPDKRIDQATTNAQIAKLFSKQSKHQSMSRTGRD